MRGAPPGPTWTEADRLAALDRCRILETPPGEAFDTIARLATAICETPIRAMLARRAEGP